MVRFKKAFLLTIIVGCLLSDPVLAEGSPENPVEWLAQLETEVLGQSNGGGLFDRLNLLEETLTGRVRDDSLVNRLLYLDKLMYVNQPHDISLIYKIQALEWVLYKKVCPGSLKERIETIEDSLYKRKFNGPLTQRIEKLVNQVFPGGAVKGSWVTLPEGLLVKVKIIDEISSATNSPGDSFRYEVVDTVCKDRHVVFPKGAIGTGVLQMVKRPGKFGNDARLTLDFKAIRALDGTPVNLYYGAKAGENNRTRRLVMGASTAGMLIFGPEGVLIGLAVKGKEKVIPAATEFYLRIREPIRVFTIIE